MAADWALEEAQRLITENDLSAARERIDEGLSIAGLNPSFYSDAISVLMLGRMYDDAERVYLAFEKAAGTSLDAEFSLDEIRNERERARAELSSMSFRRLTLFERGHASNYFTIFPVTQLDLDAEAITLRRRGRSWRYPWSAVRVTIERRPARKAFGSTAFAHYEQRLCTIYAADTRFRFDLSDQYPDFNAPRNIISALEKHTQVLWEGEPPTASGSR